VGDARRWLGIGLVGALAALVGADLWADARRPDPRFDAAAITVGLADALPGVGPARRQVVAAAIRAGRLGELPPALRLRVQELVRLPESGMPPGSDEIQLVAPRGDLVVPPETSAGAAMDQRPMTNDQ
jgi:hypothetical protein